MPDRFLNNYDQDCELFEAKERVDTSPYDYKEDPNEAIGYRKAVHGYGAQTVSAARFERKMPRRRKKPVVDEFDPFATHRESSEDDDAESSVQRYDIEALLVEPDKTIDPELVLLSPHESLDLCRRILDEAKAKSGQETTSDEDRRAALEHQKMLERKEWDKAS